MTGLQRSGWFVCVVSNVWHGEGELCAGMYEGYVCGGSSIIVILMAEFKLRNLRHEQSAGDYERVPCDQNNIKHSCLHLV